ncbi:peroxiredoxin family protein [Natronogracilivirga saccharolytica]|uniref:Redoxin domain-containing protein n=1 Tax=Natronogracilivirga saccharolytica TaxID=2812953 RepID=A0A8J7UXH5_9BACT|nr:redoxin domain-containing protein [Natronogracilivirga saccharolytica]MBP3193329.1 redoxin domain-containing protein [Natronogracilivirga saccharolytica]
MKIPIIFTLLVLFLVQDSATAQQWVQDYIQREGFNPDSIVAYIHGEMQGEVDSPVPDFSFTPLGSKQSLSLDYFNGQPTVLMLWKKGCSGSRMQLFELEKLHEKYVRQGLNILYVSPESDSTLKAFEREHHVSGKMATIQEKELSNPYQLFATPSVFVVNKAGLVQDVWLKPKKVLELEEIITPHLK